jgi:hypothetical protein
VLCPLSCSWPSWQHAAIWLEPRVMGTCPDMPDFWQAATDAAENQVDKAMDAPAAGGDGRPDAGGVVDASQLQGAMDASRSGIGGARRPAHGAGAVDARSWSRGAPRARSSRLGAMHACPRGGGALSGRAGRGVEARWTRLPIAGGADGRACSWAAGVPCNGRART